MNRNLCAALLGLAIFSAARADNPSDKSTPPNSTLSPDKRYGITVPPTFTAKDAFNQFNALVDMKSKRVLGYINADTAFARMNHSELLPAWWSADDDAVLWQVEGKWGKDMQMLVRLKDGEIDWELDVLTVLRRAILTRTEANDPKKFLAAKKSNWSGGSAYPEKFVTDSEAEHANRGPLTFPVRFHVYLTSNCKNIDPEGVDSSMEATLNREGEIIITGFHMGRTRSAPWYEVQAMR
jgi:hypothetical protein